MSAIPFNVVYHGNAHCQHSEHLSPRREGLKLIKLHLAEHLLKYLIA